MSKALQSISRLFALLAIFCCVGTTFAQRSVTGTVTDAETGEPIPGVAVLLRGTTTGAYTDGEGRYSVVAPNEDAVLVFSYYGYATREIPVEGENEIDIALESSVGTLEEVVVTGYASQKRGDVTGSVSVVDVDEMIAQPTSNVANQLQGRAAGVTVIQDGRPGSPSKVRIRGFSSFQNNDPLYIVDGVPTQDISTLNPNDIENITVLKDAGAASIYGSRASNGVIVVTTKRGTEGVRVNFNMYYGVQDPGDGPEYVLNTQEFADLQWLVYRNDGTNEIHPIYGPSPAAGGSNPQLPSWAADTDWWDVLTETAPIQNYDLSLSGGNRNAKFYGSINYFSQDGIFIHSNSERFSGRFNAEFNIKDRVTIGENLTVTHTSRTYGIGNNVEGAPINGTLNSQPIIPHIITTPIEGISHNFVPGEFGGTGIAPRLGNLSNFYANLTRDKDDFRYDLRILGNAFVDVKILKGLNFRTTFGGTYTHGYFNNYTFATYERAENVATPQFTEGANYGGDWVWTNTLTFNRDLGAHTILAVGGYESVKYDLGRGVSGQRAGYFSDDVSFRTLSNGATIVNANSGVSTPTTLVSYFGRVDYDFNDRYFVSATVRRDGSSRFGEENRYGTFPSFTAAWRISQEPFLMDNSIISNFKLRGGYGTMGNQLAVSPQNAFFLFGGSPNTSNYDLDGTGTSSLQGFRPTRIGNPDAKWETNVTTNVGFDASFFDNRIELIFDWYNKETQDLLFNPELPGTAGAASAPFINIAEMRNTGVDLQFIYRDQYGSDWQFEANLTFTTYQNEIVKLAEGVEFFDFGGSRIGPFNRNQVGQSISSFFGYEVLGLFQNDAEVASAPTQDGAEPGFFQFADLAGPEDEAGNLTGPDGVIDQNDRTFIGNPNPDFTYGLNLSVAYKDFDLSAFFYGSQGADIFNYTLWWIDFWPSFQNQKSRNLLYNSWTPENPEARTPKASNISNFSTNTQSTSYYVEDGSYLRLRNLQLGYNLPSGVASKVGLRSARVYLQGANLFTITDYSGQDPELGGDDRAFGVDEGNFPVVKQYLFGVNLGF